MTPTDEEVDDEFKKENSNIGNQDIICPFCGETDFDLFGLKLHFLNGWCDVFNETSGP